MIGKNFVFQQMKQGINMHEVIPQNRVVDQLRKKKFFQRKTSQNVMRIRNHFLLIEQEMIKTFEYVEPNSDNLKLIQ